MNAKKKGRKVCTVQSLTEQTHLYRQQKMGPLSWNQAEGAPAAWCLCCFQESDCIFVFAAIALYGLLAAGHRAHGGTYNTVFFGRWRQASLPATGNRETKGREIDCSILAQQNVSWQPNVGFAVKAVLLTQVVSRPLQMEQRHRIVHQRLPKSHIFSGEQISLFCL